MDEIIHQLETMIEDFAAAQQFLVKIASSSDSQWSHRAQRFAGEVASAIAELQIEIERARNLSKQWTSGHPLPD
jgi:hypothetical protein